jgi:ABC-type multidrug transport system fused ATPase/permease subunit
LITNPPVFKELPWVKGEIEFRRVWFEYLPGMPVLKDISFKVAPGEKVALVGPTGSGKTTIISLISRLYDIQKGEIFLDGVDIRTLPLQSLRSVLGVVMQDVFLFSGDIKGNIRLNKNLTDEEVQKIAGQVHADTFIERFPRKYDEEVKERGVTLSAGERQLLSFARALAFDPPVLVLDEATANIDSATEKLIQDALARLMQGRTSIVIAHRLSTIKNVNRIYVLHKGEIKEVGSHQELLKKRGVYYNLYRLQHGKEAE